MRRTAAASGGWYVARPPIVLLDDGEAFDEPEATPETAPEMTGATPAGRRPIRVRLEAPTDAEVRRHNGRGRTYRV